MAERASERAADSRGVTGQGPTVANGWHNTARRLATLALVAALLFPLLRNEDGLPLSTFPMYATPRTGEVNYVVAYLVDDDREHRLDMRQATGSIDPLVAESTLNAALRKGSADALCRDIARRLDTGSATVEVRVETHDVVRYATGDPTPLATQVAARCTTP